MADRPNPTPFTGRPTPLWAGPPEAWRPYRVDEPTPARMSRAWVLVVVALGMALALIGYLA